MAAASADGVVRSEKLNFQKSPRLTTLDPRLLIGVVPPVSTTYAYVVVGRGYLELMQKRGSERVLIRTGELTPLFTHSCSGFSGGRFSFFLLTTFFIPAPNS